MKPNISILILFQKKCGLFYDTGRHNHVPVREVVAPATQ